MALITRTSNSFSLGIACTAALVCLLGLGSCSIWETNDNDFWNRPQGNENFGMRPIYARADAQDIYSDVTRAVVNNISVFEEGNLLFTVDADEGVHVYDNSDPRNPIALTFIRILGVRTASVTGNFLYANNFEDFVTIDISDLSEVEVVDRQEDFYEGVASTPANYSGFFECYDPARGPLRGWEEGPLNDPECRTF